MKDTNRIVLEKVERLLTKIIQDPLLRKEVWIKKPEKSLKLKIALKIESHSEPLRETQQMVFDLLEGGLDLHVPEEGYTLVDCCFLTFSIEALKIPPLKSSNLDKGTLQKFESLL